MINNELIKLVKSPKELPDIWRNKTIIMNDTGDDMEIYTNTGTPTTQGSSLSEIAAVAKSCKTIGTLLSYNETTGIYTIWNGEPGEPGYWDPRSTSTYVAPSTENGTVIAACVGEGLWAIVGSLWSDYNVGKAWALADTDLYNYYIPVNVKGNGWDNTNHIFSNYQSSIQDGTIWYSMKNTSIPGVKNWNNQVGDTFLPDKMQLLTICYNTSNDQTGADHTGNGPYLGYTNNIGRLLGVGQNNSWSSSQYPYYYNIAFYVNFTTGFADYITKSTTFRGVLCLHF